MSRILAVFMFACALRAEAGSALALPPLQSENRTVTTVTDATRALVVGEPMVWLDQSPPTRGIRILDGTYVLEAEDGDYLYYRAPSDIEYRVFKNGAVVDGRFMPGGIYFSKALLAIVPAGAYLSVDGAHKVLTWKLGLDFIRMEGSKWKRTGKE